MINIAIFDPPEWNRREIMRYARIRGADDSYRELIDDCIAESEPLLSYRVCYTVLSVSRDNDSITFGNMTTTSHTVRKAIRNAQQILLFAATVGAPFDRVIQKYSKLSPSKALIMQAVGAERVESLCDAFYSKMTNELCDTGMYLTPRVSPGYGDIPLSMQRDIFTILDCPRKIGLTLDESLLMAPSKSVTAICGVTAGENLHIPDKCSVCSQRNCVYRKD